MASDNDKETECRYCGETIVFLVNGNGRKVPVNAETVTKGDTVFCERSGHESHFAMCTETARREHV